MNQFGTYAHQPPRAGPESRSEEGGGMQRIRKAVSASRDDLHTIDRGRAGRMSRDR
jgi:hypothetical protein